MKSCTGAVVSGDRDRIEKIRRTDLSAITKLIGRRCSGYYRHLSTYLATLILACSLLPIEDYLANRIKSTQFFFLILTLLNITEPSNFL